MSDFKAVATAKFTLSGDVAGLIRSKIVPQISEAARAGAQAVFDLSQEYVAVDTGALKASGKVEDPEDDGQRVTARVTYDSEHAGYIEFGTGQRGVESGTAPSDWYDPNWKGMRAQPYLRPAADSSHDAIEGAFRKIKL